MPTQVRVVVAHGDKDGGKTPKRTHTYTHTTSGRTRTCGGTLGQKVSAEPCCQHHWEARQNTKVQKNHSMFSPRSSRTSPETTNALWSARFLLFFYFLSDICCSSRQCSHQTRSEFLILSSVYSNLCEPRAQPDLHTQVITAFSTVASGWCCIEKPHPPTLAGANQIKANLRGWSQKKMGKMFWAVNHAKLLWKDPRKILWSCKWAKQVLFNVFYEPVLKDSLYL